MKPHGSPVVIIANPEDAGQRLDVFLCGHLDTSRSKAQQLIRGGYVSSDGPKPLKQSLPVESGDRFEVVIPPADKPDFLPEPIPLDILYEDSHIIVVNKSPGMVVHPGRGNIRGTLAGALLAHAGNIAGVGEPLRPGIVHRLDKNTSGVLVAALDEHSHRRLSDMIKNREVTRRYIAYVWGRPDPTAGTIEVPIGRHPRYGTRKAVRPDGRPAVTHYETVGTYEFVTKLDIRLETGRTHQIRVHLAHIGHHVFGDPDYGGREERLGGFRPEVRLKARRLLGELGRQALHAHRLAFNHPVDGRPLVFTAPLPGDLARFEAEITGG